MNDIQDLGFPITLVKPLSFEMEQSLMNANNPATCDKGTIQATCKPSGVIN